MNGMEVRTNEQMNEQMNERTNIRTDEQIDENYIPLGINAGGIIIDDLLIMFQIMEVNVKATFFLCKEVVPYIEKRR